MVYRKGELSRAMVDSRWPHQVALPAAGCSGASYVSIRQFCRDLSLCPRGHTFRRNDVDMNVFCFAELAHAQAFQRHFGGEFIAPKDRPKWPGSRAS